MAGHTVYVKPAPITERLVEFVDEIAGYVETHDLDDDLDEIIHRTRDDLARLRTSQDDA
jgi:hypothetical protein